MLITAPQRPSRQPTPTRAPKPQPKPRPAAPLRVVTDAELRDAQRRARARTFVLTGLVLFAVSIFAVVVAHVVLMQSQFELEDLQRKSAAKQAEFDRLRLQVADLESPDRIVATAQERLGMVEPPKITYLAPSPDAAPAATETPTPLGNREAAVTARPASWSTVKPHLSAG